MPSRLFDDTSPEAEEVLIEGYRRMSPASKLQKVGELTRAVQQMALARIRAEHPAADARELRLRLASLWIDADTMRAAFGWDPDREGY